nr:MAG TPA: hypothetical protein [Caudoviricetes sp.]
MPIIFYTIPFGIKYFIFILGRNPNIDLLLLAVCSCFHMRVEYMFTLFNRGWIFLPPLACGSTSPTRRYSLKVSHVYYTILSSICQYI